MALTCHAGWAKGMKISAPPGRATRPTSARVVEALIDLIRPYFSVGPMIDAFAGSGAVGIAAASCGCPGVVFIESSASVQKHLRANLAELKRRAANANLSLSPCQCIHRRAEQAVSQFAAWQPGVIFLDPPYRETSSWLAKYSASVVSSLNHGGAVVVESAAGYDPEEFMVKGAALVKHRQYGDSMISIWEQEVHGTGSDLSR